MKTKIGICGLPNSGKSSFIKLCTKSEVEIANYPFTTLKSGEYSFFIYSPELKELYKVTKTKEVILDYLILIDVPGLIRGAHKGEGLGNEFLSYLRKSQAILEIVRNFKNDDVPHFEGSIDPIRDILIIEEEIIASEKEIIERNLKSLKKEDKEREKVKILEKILDEIQPFKRFEALNEFVKEYNLLITKPWYLLINGNEIDLDEEIKKTFKKIYFLDVKWELDLREEKEDYYLLSKLDNFANEFRKDLDLIQFFTFTKEITQEWFIKNGSTYKEAAGLIHSEFEEKIKAVEVINLFEFLEIGDWENAKKQGKIKIKSKDDKVEENDILLIKI